MNLLKRNWLSDTGSLQLFQLLRYGSLLAINIILTKTQLTSYAIGYVETFLFISGAVSFFWVSGLLQATLAAYPSIKDAFQRDKLLFNVALLMLLITVLIGAGLWLGQQQVTSVAIGTSAFPYYKHLVLFVLLNNISFLNEYILLLKKKYKEIVLYGVGAFVLQIVLVTAPVISGYTLEYVFYGWIIFAFLKLSFLMVLLIKYTQMEPDFRLMLRHFIFALPLVLTLLISGSAEYIDSLIVSHYFDASAFAIFRYGARELPIVLLLANAFSTALIPFISENTKKALPDLKKRSARLMHWLFPISIVLMLTSRWLFPWVFNEEFLESAYIFNIYLLLIVTRLLFPQPILIALGKNKYILITSAIELTVNVFFSLLLVRYMGLAGVAFATVIAFAVDKIMLMYFCYRKTGIRSDEYTPYRVFIPYTILLLLAWSMSTMWF